MSKKINKKRNKTRKINVSRHETKNSDSAAAATKVQKIKIDDKVGCITVNNSFEENFNNYFNRKKKYGNNGNNGNNGNKM